MSPELNRLQTLIDRLRALELRIPQPHERPILDVARSALNQEISALSTLLQRSDYLRSPRARRRAS